MNIERKHFDREAINRFLKTWQIDEIDEDFIIDAIMNDSTGNKFGDTFFLFFGQGDRYELDVQYCSSKIELVPTAYGIQLSDYAETIYKGEQP